MMCFVLAIAVHMITYDISFIPLSCLSDVVFLVVVPPPSGSFPSRPAPASILFFLSFYRAIVVSSFLSSSCPSYLVLECFLLASSLPFSMDPYALGKVVFLVVVLFFFFLVGVVFLGDVALSLGGGSLENSAQHLIPTVGGTAPRNTTRAVHASHLRPRERRCRV